jgi:hypothetical protein
MDNVMINKVSESGLITLNLEDYYPKNETMVFDLKEFLFMGLILKEKDYREALKNFDFSIYADKYVSVFCSTDAVIPMWAYMLATSYLQPISKSVIFGSAEFLLQNTFIKKITAIDPAIYSDKRVVIKGCGELPISEEAYVSITQLLRPVAKSIMYGEPCSTVPIFKSKPAL